MMMDWEVGGNGNVSSMVIAEEEDDGDEETTKHKLTSKWSSRIHDKTFPAINSNPTDLSVSSHHHHLLRSTPTTTSASLLVHQYHHHPFSNINTPPSASSINGLSPKIAHLYVSTSSATTSSSSPSSSGSEGQQLSPCISLDLTTTSSIKSESTNSSTNNNKTAGSGVRRPKPIPPPLDLSIGAANLSLNSPSLVTPTPTTLQRESHLLASYNNSFCSSGGSITNSPFYWASSPKFNQAEKTLPLRKRWHSWSPIQMNCPEDPMLPLYTDTHLMSIKQDRGNGDNHGLGLQNGGSMIQNGYGSSRGSHASPGQSNGNQSPNNQQQSNSIFNQSTGLQTPTPFYTPNEPSPKFMNSPVFSYSTPDTTLYQGPFSPIRSTILYPPTSPFMNGSSSLNTPTFSMAPNVISTAPTSMTMSGINNSCFNMVPSTLLSPAPSQASTNSNSLSYEDLHEKSSSTSIASLNLFNPIWNIFMSGTRVRFAGGMNPLDWYFVDFLAQSGESIGLKEDYAPNGLQVRTLVVPCSSKERITITFCPIADPHHPAIEVNCESGHPFMVEKKGWCAVKPDAFFETYGTHCQTLEGGDVCLSLAAASLTSKSPPQTHQQQQHQQHSQPTQHSQNHNFTAQLCLMDQGPPPGTGTTPVSMTNGLSPSSSALSTVDVKPVPISVIPQQPQTLTIPPQQIIQLRDPPLYHKKLGTTLVSGGKRTNKDSNNGPGEQKGRRPMNAFLLFAKDKRPELIQQYPGKDNRSISVLLGEAWQGLAPPEKEKYAASARLRAEEQKRMHPDCWKRKRSQSQPAV